MIRYPLEKWMRYAVAGMVFAIALLLTPRAFLDVTYQADSHEIPVDMLEPTDDCVWCSTLPDDFQQADCDNLDEDQRHWLNPDRVDLDDLPADCRDDIRSIEPSA